MQTQYLVPILVLSLLQSLAAQQHERITVPLAENTAQGSPFEVVLGQIVLDETVAVDQLTSSWGGKVVAKNISGKQVLLVVASLSLVGRHNHGSVRGPGDGATYLLCDDRFFAPGAIKPGDALTVWDGTPDKERLECCLNPLDPVDVPKAEFRVRFVQFADGSTYGDSSEARKDLTIRTAIIDGLRQLLQSYTQHGEQAFLSEMKQRLPWSNTSIFAKIQTSYEQNGVRAAIARVQQILAVAESHEALIGQAPPTPSAGGAR